MGLHVEDLLVGDRIMNSDGSVWDTVVSRDEQFVTLKKFYSPLRLSHEGVLLIGNVERPSIEEAKVEIAACL